MPRAGSAAKALGLVGVLLVVPGTGHAEPSAPPPAVAPSPPPSPPAPTRTSNELRYSLAIDLPVTLAAAGWLFGSEAGKQDLVPSSCVICELGPNGADHLNGFDAYFRRAFVRRDTTAADVTSNVLGYGVAPTSAIVLLALAAQRDDGSLQNTPVDLLLTAEATFLSMDVNQVVKLLLPRERPFLHFADADTRATPQSAESRVSFYSLHTSATFALAVSAGTIAELRGYSIAPLIFGSGLLVGAATGYMRMAADKHYMSDVLVGAGMGSLIGFVVPYSFHRPLPGNLRLSGSPLPGGGLIGASAVF